MRLGLNLLWFILGGWLAGLAWLLTSALMAISVVGLPWALASLRIASFSAWPFGRDLVSRKIYEGQANIGLSGLSVVGNIIWVVLCGWFLALAHACAAIGSAITIIGIPFAIQHIKLIGITFAPLGQVVVSKEKAQALRKRSAEAQVNGNQAVVNAG